MEKQAGEVLRDALALPAEARTALIESLIESLDDVEDDGVEEAWATEVQRRIQEIDSGAVELIAWHTARERLGRRLGR